MRGNKATEVEYEFSLLLVTSSDNLALIIMVNLRLRHPKGVTTITVDLDSATVLELQHIIFSATEITPSRQECACTIPSHWNANEFNQRIERSEMRLSTEDSDSDT
jgi:hypothetical protein